MIDKKSVRIDKFLWAVRIYKTRTLAAEACLMGRILINDLPVKPSKIIEGNETLSVKKPPVTFTYKIIAPPGNRVSAKLVTEYLSDLTPENEKAKLNIHHPVFPGFRKRGSGRPTKKERRSIDRWRDGFNIFL
jgi:ribosome-associated heat shock protein Hsp15